jgi:hypothetical protein
MVKKLDHMREVQCKSREKVTCRNSSRHKVEELKGRTTLLTMGFD